MNDSTPDHPYKVCRACWTKLPIILFHKDKQKSDGFSVYCKPCKIQKVLASRVKHRDHFNAYQRKLYQRQKQKKERF